VAGLAPPKGVAQNAMQNAKNAAQCYTHQWGIRYKKHLFYRLKKYLTNGTVLASIYSMKNKTFTLENRKMEMQILYISDCCGAYLDDAQIEYGICNDCGEHCEVLTEEYPATPVCGG